MNFGNFLAYARRKGLDNSKPELEVGVNYDFALDIDERNGWKEHGEGDSQLIESLIQVASRGLNELLIFCFKDRVLGRGSRGLQMAFRRFVAVAWLLNSNMLRGKDGKPLSLEQLSKLPQIDCTRCALSLLAQEFGDKWGFRARVQKRAGTKENYAASAKTGWVKRRSRQSQVK